MNIKHLSVIALALFIGTCYAQGQTQPVIPASSVAPDAVLEPMLLRTICTKAVMREESPTYKLRVGDVSYRLGTSPMVAFCDVRADAFEGDGLVLTGKKTRTFVAQYEVQVDLWTGYATATRVDGSVAQDIARETLSDLYIKLQPKKMSRNDVTYRATVAGKACEVEVARQPDEGSSWEVRKLDCAHR